MSTEARKESDLVFPGYPSATTSVNEIDLLELIALLWQSKKIILAVIFVFMLAGLSATWLIPEKWTSKAMVAPAEISQWSAFEKMLTIPEALEVDMKIGRDDIFRRFIQKFQSPVLREAYFTSLPAPLQLAADLEPDSLQFRILLQAASEKMKAVSSGNDRNGEKPSFAVWTLSYTDRHADTARMILNGYIQYVSDIVVREMIQDIRSAVALKTQQEKEQQKLARVHLANSHNADIQRLSHSLDIANSAGITKPLYDDESNKAKGVGYPLSLGAKGIEQKLALEKSIHNIEQLNADFQNRQYRIAQLEKFDIDETDFQPFYYQLPSTLPLYKEGPGKMLIVLAAALIGGVLACFSILLRQALVSRNAVRLLEQR